VRRGAGHCSSISMSHRIKGDEGNRNNSGDVKGRRCESHGSEHQNC
jgi:hypothetical protein